MPTSGISKLEGIEEDIGKLKVTIKIESQNALEQSKLSKLLGYGRNTIFDAGSLFNFEVQKVQGIIEDSLGSKRKENLKRDDNTIEGIEHALAYSLPINVGEYNLQNFKTIIFAFLSTIDND